MSLCTPTIIVCFLPPHNLYLTLTSVLVAWPYVHLPLPQSFPNFNHPTVPKFRYYRNKSLRTFLKHYRWTLIQHVAESSSTKVLSGNKVAQFGSPKRNHKVILIKWFIKLKSAMWHSLIIHRNKSLNLYLLYSVTRSGSDKTNCRSFKLIVGLSTFFFFALSARFLSRKKEKSVFFTSWSATVFLN